MKQAMIFLFALICTFTKLPAQKGGSHDCPSNANVEPSYSGIEFYLQAPYFEEYRVESGTNNISLDQIRQVEDQSTCGELMNIVLNNEKYNTVHELLINDGYTLQFFESDSFYFIDWTFKYPETPPGTIYVKTGPRRLFLVISSDFQTVREFKV